MLNRQFAIRVDNHTRHESEFFILIVIADKKIKKFFFVVQSHFWLCKIITRKIVQGNTLWALVHSDNKLNFYDAVDNFLFHLQDERYTISVSLCSGFWGRRNKTINFLLWPIGVLDTSLDYTWGPDPGVLFSFPNYFPLFVCFCSRGAHTLQNWALFTTVPFVRCIGQPKMQLLLVDAQEK